VAKMNDTIRNSKIDDLVHALQEQKLKKYDVITPGKDIVMMDGKFIIDGIEAEPNKLFADLQIDVPAESLILTPSEYFHGQMAEKMQIPKNYYDKCLIQKGNLLSDQVNYWLKNSGKNYMIRSFKDVDSPNGYARAFLSDRFKTIDNFDILITALDEIKNFPNIQIEACDLSETKMYVRFFDPTIEVSAPELLKNYRNPQTGNTDSGNTIISGFTLTNSEVGAGGFSISPRGIILACSNGMTQKQDQLRRVHLGEKQDTGFIQWSDETDIQNLRLIQSQTKDAIRTFLSPEYWNKVIDRITEKAVLPLDHPLECTKNVCKSLSLSDKQTENVLNYFMDGGQRNRFGVVQAVTFLAHETENSDLQYSLEEQAMELIPVMDKYDIVNK
jgi:hypothetical protein